MGDVSYICLSVWGMYNIYVCVGGDVSYIYMSVCVGGGCLIHLYVCTGMSVTSVCLSVCVGGDVS